jgi:hypothetical protein
VQETATATDVMNGRFLWVLIDDSQGTTWTVINAHQETNWDVIDTSASTDWTLIDTVNN